MPTKSNTIKKQEMIKALTKALGVVTKACNTAHIDRSTHYDWYNNDPDYKKAVDDVAEVALDFAEAKLHEQIDEKDTAATIFYLKTKGKKRGYIEKVETGFTNAEGKDVLPQIVLQPAPNCEEIKEG